MGLVIPSGSGEGIQVDHARPVFGWRDIEGAVELRGTGPNDPTFTTYGALPFRFYSFSATAMKEVYALYHIPHDYLPGSRFHFHVHWSNAEAAPNTGNVRWGFEYSWARGFNQMAFSAPATVYVVQACPATRYQHMIAETEAVELGGIEVDSLITMRIFRDAAHGDDTCTDAVFAHTADLHYQSTNMATKNKSPNFYQ